jgi:hypothetical protein
MRRAAPRLSLDYVAEVRRLRWPGIMVLVLSLALGAWLLGRYRDAREDLAQLEATSALIAPQRRPPRALPRERLAEETRSAEAVVRQLTVPWASLVQAIEEAATRDVALLQLQPDAESRSLKLTAEARHPEAMFEYLHRLGAGRGLDEVHLVSHHMLDTEAQRPIQFSVQASIRGSR